jgi:hypothetical protein
LFGRSHVRIARLQLANKTWPFPKPSSNTFPNASCLAAPFFAQFFSEV